MNKKDLIKSLKLILDRQLKALESKDIRGNFDADHIEADNLLIEYINDDEVTKIFEAIQKWYS